MVLTNPINHHIICVGLILRTQISLSTDAKTFATRWNCLISLLSVLVVETDCEDFFITLIKLLKARIFHANL